MQGKPGITPKYAHGVTVTFHMVPDPLDLQFAEMAEITMSSGILCRVAIRDVGMYRCTHPTVSTYIRYKRYNTIQTIHYNTIHIYLRYTVLFSVNLYEMENQHANQ